MSTIIRFRRLPFEKWPDWKSTFVPSGLKLGWAWSGFIFVSEAIQ